MTTLYLGINPPGQRINVAKGTSTNSKYVELAIDLAKLKNRNEVLDCVEAIKAEILQDTTYFTSSSPTS